ncbi:MAG: GGDEF domain-containing protein [Candidatus Eremiobacteraeota bacterium]|nr:GGDEF domain-containing protein [Candidatus Eremiobacteraeota bacterium]
MKRLALGFWLLVLMNGSALAAPAPLAVYASPLERGPAGARDDPRGLPYVRTDRPFSHIPLPWKPQVLWVRIEPSDFPKAGSAAITFRSNATERLVYVARPDGSFQRITSRQNFIALPCTGRSIYARMIVTLDRIPSIEPLVAAELDERRLVAWSQFFVGFFLAIGLFNLLIFAVLRDPPFLWYAGIMASMIGIEAVSTPLVRPYLDVLGPAAPPMVRVISLCTYFVCIVFFSRSFLRLRQAYPVVDATIMVILAANLFAIPAEGLLNNLWPFAWLDDVLLGSQLVALMFAGVLMFRRGNVAARYYIIAFAGAALGIIFNDAAERAGMHADWLIYTLQIGIAWEAIFLALALADRTQRTAVENEQLGIAKIQAEVLASHDGLTGVANRRAFDLALANAWRTAGRTLDPLAIVILDVDDFKKYNDTHGHLPGDDVLRRIAHACEECSRRGVDIFARYGGEEFAAILPRASVKEATTVAERMRSSVETLGICQIDGTPVTVSIGVVVMGPGETTASDALLNRADAALYSAKERGKNCVVLARASDISANA